MSDDRLIVALDLPDVRSGLDLATRLGPMVSFYKIGLGMLATGGLALARELKDDHGKRIFLDLKLFDIASTVERAVRSLARFDVDLLTVQGDPPIVRAAREGAADTSLRILAVTVLTSLDRADLDAAMVRDGDVADIAVERAARALAAGADGVVSSPREAARIRALSEADGKQIVCPGIRLAGSAPGDQKRTAGAAEALRAGADRIVVGRPIYAAMDPVAATAALLDEIRAVT